MQKYFLTEILDDLQLISRGVIYYF